MPPVRVRVWFRVSVKIRVGGGAIFFGGNCLKTLITRCFRSVNIVKFLRTVLLNTSRSIRLQMFFKIDALKSFGNFNGTHLSWSLFLKNLQAEDLQLY